MVATRRRAQSFSHLPRPRLSREEFVEYLGERMAANHAGDPNPPDGSADGGAAPEAAIVGAKEPGIVLGDESSQVPPAIMVEGVEEALEGGVGDGNDSSGEIIPRRLRIVRRWPSSADIGMFTDGR